MMIYDMFLSNREISWSTFSEGHAESWTWRNNRKAVRIPARVINVG